MVDFGLGFCDSRLLLLKSKSLTHVFLDIFLSFLNNLFIPFIFFQQAINHLLLFIIIL
jgi:hypothetical protein